jgi:putative DNA primase/helicase
MGIIKALTGGDRITARNLFEDQTAFRNKAKLILSCNDLPKPSSQDNGVWRRVRVVHFPINFVENPTEEHEKLRDNTLETQVKEWKESFISILIEKYKILKTKYNGTIPEPKEVTEYTDNYREETNTMLQFSREVIEEAPGESIKLTDLYQIFRTWFIASCPGEKTPHRRELIDFIIKKYKKKATKLSLKGYRIKDDEDVPTDEKNREIVIAEKDELS